MRLRAARVQNYRSVRDTGLFDVERDKTILVGPNEAGKTAVLQALQRIKAPDGVKGFDALRDYPRALYNDITVGTVKADEVPVATAIFELEEDERAVLPESLRGVRYGTRRYLDNSIRHWLVDAPELPTLADISRDLQRLAAHVDGRTAVAEGEPASTAQSAKLRAILGS